MKIDRQDVGNWIKLLTLFVAAFMVGLCIGKEKYWAEGFRAAFFSYKCGCIECDVKKHHPEWLENGK